MNVWGIAWAALAVERRRLGRAALLVALLCAAAAPAQAPAQSLEKVTLTKQTSFPQELAVTRDGRVFFVELAGAIKLYRPDRGSTTQIGSLDVATENENGLLGIALDPGFASNGFAYLYYSPAGTDFNRLSRFTISSNAVNMGSEKVLLTVPRDDTCCHQGGSLAFAPNGDLYLATGENTQGHELGGWTPIDERPGRALWDAQRTSSNTNDLRGKVLRIRPTTGGGYTVPGGNLFAPGTPGTRPEIYVMGARNPYRISIDPETGWLYFADVGPDAPSNHPTLGSMGFDEINQARSAGNYGWPYCIGNNRPYGDYHGYLPNGEADPNSTTGLFNCTSSGPWVNDSPNNTGATNLPGPPEGAFIWYSYGDSPQGFSAIEDTGDPPGGRSGFAGPVYRYRSGLKSRVKLPERYDGSLFIYDWERDWINEVELTAGGAIAAVKPFRKGLNGPIDLEIGPNGSMYLLEMGDYTGANPGLYQIRTKVRGGVPRARARANRTSGALPLTVRFSSRGSRDPDGGRLRYAWDFDGNGKVDSRKANPRHTYRRRGDFSARLTVTDPQRNRASSSVTITAGNSAPLVRFAKPQNGGVYSLGDQIAYRVVVRDREDGRINCRRVTVRISLGHSTHFHPMSTDTGCRGTVQTASAGGHGPADNLFGVLEATYTDRGARGVRALRGSAIYTLQPKHKQAEFSSRQKGVSVAATSDPEGGESDVTSIGGGDSFSFAPISLFNVDQIAARVSAPGAGGTIELRAGGPGGRVVGRIQVGAGDWQTVAANVCDPGRSVRLFAVFRGFNGAARVNWLEFRGGGVTKGAQVSRRRC